MSLDSHPGGDLEPSGDGLGYSGSSSAEHARLIESLRTRAQKAAVTAKEVRAEARAIRGESAAGTAGRTEAAIALRRFVNDNIARVATTFDRGEDSLFEFVCECGDLSCRQLVAMTLSDYRGSQPGSIRH